MNSQHVETVLHALSRSSSRRSVLRLLTGSTFSGLLALGALPTDAKRTRRKGKGKKKNRPSFCATCGSIGDPNGDGDRYGMGSPDDMGDPDDRPGGR